MNRIEQGLNRFICLSNKHDVLWLPMNRITFIVNRFMCESYHLSFDTIHQTLWLYILFSLKLLNHLHLFSLGLKLIPHTFFKIKHFFIESLYLWVCRFSRVLVRIVSWFSQEDWLSLIKASKELNNLIPPRKGLGVFQTVLETEGGSFTRRSIEDSS